ncbi:MAG: hypothetical protein CMN30_33355 [Sandaracinus sp.]|nr:hypothetical protein [Sandaracinus sp.]MAR56607.1 hypothetical protein [Rickettsiales bacterium]|tara:strand:- start:1085 stop:1918 length:834 start_codon:yes stop_codon:yes gene_type:complete
MGAELAFRPGAWVGLVARVEQTAGATGALVCEVDGRQLGSVLLERGRVCWAVTRSTRRRLSDLLLERSSDLTRVQLEAVYRLCRARSIPLGEELVRRGFVSPRQLREALVEHTSEALVHMAEADRATYRWVPHRTPTYSPKYTFDNLELTLRIGRMIHQERSDAAEARLAALGFPGVAFRVAEDEGVVLPVAVRDRDRIPAAHLPCEGPDLRALRQWLESHAGRESLRFAVWHDGEGRRVALVRTEMLLLVLWLDGASALGLLLARLANLPAVGDAE